MNSSLNHVYRIVWNAALGLWQVASEATRGRGKTGSSQQVRKARRALAAAGLTLAAPAAWAVLPTGGVVVAGQASISQAGNALNIVQGTDKAAIDWQSFSIGQGNTVNFQQLSSSSVALNRVLGNDVSVIQGAINANGQVFLVNQNGVLFTPTAQVNVGGIVASTQNISTDDFMAGRYKFSGNSTATVENQGSIKAADGGVVALIAAKVINTGSIEALRGTVGLAAGNTVLLDLGGPVKIQVTEGALNAAIEQSGGIRADGGTVYLTAKAAGNLAASVINHTGVTKALSMASLTGEAAEVAQATGSIALSADLVNQAGTLDVSGLRGGQIDVLAGQYTDSGTTLADGSQQGGSIDVRAKNITQTSSAVVSASSSEGEGGRVELIGDLGHGIGQFGGKIYATGRRRGGFVDTSGAKLILNDSLRVDTSSADGETGLWLLDPVDFTIAASGGDLTGAALNAALQSSNVTIQTLANSSVSCTGVTCGTGNTSGNGDIHVNDSINATGTNTLTLQASRDININKAVTVGGLNLTAVRNVNVNDVVTVNNSLVVNYGANADFTPNNTVRPSDNAALNMSLNSAGFTGKINLGASVSSVKLNNISYGIVRDRAGLAAIATATNGLTSNYVLAADIDLGGIEWVPLGDTVNVAAGNFFAGRVEGLGHQVSNLSINNSSDTRFNSGLFGLVADGTLTNLGVSGKVNFTHTSQAVPIYVGGLAGQVAPTSGTSSGTLLRNVFSSVDVTGTNSRDATGGFGSSPSAIAGGLIGQTGRATLLTNAYANGAVSAIANGGNASAGGLIGNISSTTIATQIYASGNVTATGGSLQSVLPTSRAGGLIGGAAAALTLNNAYATGNVRVEASSATSSNPSPNPNMRAGGLIGDISGASTAVTITSVFASGAVSVGASTAVRSTGGLVGAIINNTNVVKQIANAYWDDSQTGQTNAVGATTGTGAATVSVSATKAAIGTVGTLFPNLNQDVWAVVNGTPVLKVFQTIAAPSIQQVFIRLACGTLCFNTYGDSLPSFVFDDFAAANGTTPLTNANLTGTASFNVLDASNNTVTGFSSLSNAGTYKFVYTGGLMASGFELVAGDAVTWTVVPRTLTVALTGTTANPLTKTYDGNANLALSTQNFLLGNFAPGTSQGGTISQTNGVLNSQNVASANLVTASLTAANLSVTGDTLASNYVLPTSVFKAGMITAKALTVAGIVANGKDYDGNKTATLSNQGAVATGIDGEVLTVSTTGSFNDQNAGARKVNTTTTIADNGSTLASNYSLSNVTNAVDATIAQKAVIVAGIVANGKTYDGNATATLSNQGAVATGIVGEALTVSTTGSFNDQNAGARKVNTTTTIANNGSTLASNYSLRNATNAVDATIAQKAVTVAGIVANGKAYDGTTTATLSNQGAVETGITGEVLTVSTIGSFNDQNAGLRKVNTTSTLGNGTGGLATNYTLNNATNAVDATITQKTLSIIGSIVTDKTYDGERAATVTAGSLNGLVTVNGVTEVLGATTATGQFASKDVARDANGAVTTQNVEVMYTLVNGGSALASNYSLADETLQGSITPKALAVTGLTAQNKEYDRLLTATVTGTAVVDTTGVVGQDQVSVSGNVTGGLFATKDVGTKKAVAISGLMLTGAQAGNYMLSAAALTADITAKAVTVTGLTAATKEYDGNRTATVSSTNAVFDGIIQGDMLSVTATGLFDTQDAGTNKTVEFSALALSGKDANNYALNTSSASAKADITPKVLTVTGTTVADKIYNGNLGATVKVGELSGFVGGERLSATTATGTFADKDVARDANGEVIAKNVTVAYTLVDGAPTTSGGIGFGAPIVGGNCVINPASCAPTTAIITAPITTSGAKASNYTLASETKTAKITPKALTISGSKVTDKQYDGAQTATVTAGMLTGLLDGETLGTTTAVGTFADKNASAEAQNVTTVYTLVNGSNAAHKAGNYSLAGEVLTGKINQRVLSITGSTVAPKTYDGKKSVPVSVGTLGNLVGNETLGTTTAIGEFADPNAGSNKDVAVTYTLANGAMAKASNYTLAGEKLKGTINQKALTVSGIAAMGKAYDGNTSATLINQGAVMTGIEGETLTVSTTGTFNDKNAGARQVNTTSTLGNGTGGLASNYTLTNAANTVNATIAQKALTVNGITAMGKTYDGNTSATLINQGTVATGVGGESLTVATTGTFNDKNAGARQVNTTSTLGNGTGGLASNYILTNSTNAVDATITQKALTVNGIAAMGKTYDGNTSATLSNQGSVVTGIMGETLTVSTSGMFNDKNAGARKVNTTTTIANNGNTLASNYSLTNANNVVDATIAQKAVSVSGIVANGKTYDGNTMATLSNQGQVGTKIDGETLTVSTTGSFDKKDAGARKVNTTTTIANNGSTLASNYTLTNAANTVNATIAQKLLTIAATAISKVYNGQTTATATLSTNDVVTNDKVTLNQTAANFVNAQGQNDKNVGTAKTVRVTGLSLSGDDALNYKLNNEGAVAQTKADITAKSLSISASASNKVYNANTLADVTLSTSDMVTGDTLTLNKTAANFDTKNVGVGKTVTVEGLSLGGTDAGNYAISNANTKATTTANITQAVLSVSGITAANKTYDASTNAMVSTANAKLNGLFEGDKLVVSATGVFVDKNAATEKTVNLTSTYAGADVDNYAITDQATTTADIAKLNGVVVTADKQSKTVGSADPKLTFSVTGLLAEDALTGSLTREVGEAAGLYDITQGTLNNDNYVISQFNPAQLTISQPIADVAIANAQTLEPKLDLPSEREAMEERSGDVAPFFIAANQARASGPAQLLVVNGGIKLPAGQEEQQ